MRKAFVVLALFGCFATWRMTCQADEPQQKQNLWAGMTTNRAVFPYNWTQHLVIFFAVVNDGKQTVDSEIYKSRLFINGEEMKDWSFVVGNGPAKPKLLQPGQECEFTYAMGSYFKKPGIYKLYWQGKTFKTREITFRVLPKRK